MQNCAEREQQNAVARTDRHLAEMMATLDIYKQNNEKLLLEKDTEIQALRVRSEHAESLAAVSVIFVWIDLQMISCGISLLDLVIFVLEYMRMHMRKSLNMRFIHKLCCTY